MTRPRLTTTARGYGHRWQQLRLRVLTRDHHRCHWCGAPADCVDHLTPKIEGGTDDPTNLVASCTRCNCRRAGQWTTANRPRSPWARRARRVTPTGALVGTIDSNADRIGGSTRDDAKR